MKTKKRVFWPMAVLGALAVTLFGVSDTVQARGGGGGGRGGGGGFGGGGGRGGFGNTPTGGPSGGRGGRGAGTGNNRNNQNNKDDAERLRREERIRRVAEARIEYAKRERQESWDADVQAHDARTLGRVLGSATE